MRRRMQSPVLMRRGIRIDFLVMSRRINLSLSQKNSSTLFIINSPSSSLPLSVILGTRTLLDLILGIRC